MWYLLIIYPWNIYLHMYICISTLPDSSLNHIKFVQINKIKIKITKKKPKQNQFNIDISA